MFLSFQFRRIEVKTFQANKESPPSHKSNVAENFSVVQATELFLLIRQVQYI